MKYYPWQDDAWQRIMQARERMPHALLLQGRSGIGKLDFAKKMAQSLLCDHPLPDHSACDACPSCNWFAQENHPDFRMVDPEERDAASGSEGTSDGKGARKAQISVDQIRDLADFLALSSHRAGFRIVLLNPAEALNPASSNALLKMLEEPPPSVMFLLVTHQPQRLLATIRSRCRKVDMPVPAHAMAESWLQGQCVINAAERLAYAGGAPLNVCAQDEGDEKRLTELRERLLRANEMDPLATAAACAKEGIALVVDTLQKWSYDLLSARHSGAVHYNKPHATALQAMAKRVDLPKLLDYLRVLNEARRTAQHPLNNELQVESLMIQYVQLFLMPSQP